MAYDFERAELAAKFACELLPLIWADRDASGLEPDSRCKASVDLGIVMANRLIEAARTPTAQPDAEAGDNK
jgi:hypothetical protein